jgi:hypothetical protein
LSFKDAEYIGDVENGEPNGYGIKIWTDGVRYEGYWKDGYK